MIGFYDEEQICEMKSGRELLSCKDKKKGRERGGRDMEGGR